MFPHGPLSPAALESADMDSCVDRGLVASLMANLRDGRCKLFLTWKVLQFRRDHAALFSEGEYVPLRVSGEYATNVCAFARRYEGKLAVTIAPRLYLRLLGPERDDAPLGESVWSDTVIELPKEFVEPVSLQNLLDGQRVPAARTANRITVKLADALRNFPVGLLSHLPS